MGLLMASRPSTVRGLHACVRRAYGIGRVGGTGRKHTRAERCWCPIHTLRVGARGCGASAECIGYKRGLLTRVASDICPGPW